MRLCSIDGCCKPHSCKGYCAMHCARFKRHGDASHTRPGRDTERKRMRDTWKGMIDRCHTPGSPSYRYYGAKGISVCERWRRSFDAFLSDVGTIPKGLRLERLDNSLGYEPSNIRIATIHEQNNHKSDTRLLTHAGRTQNMTAWAREMGMSPAMLHYRLSHGWPTDAALTTPTIPSKYSRTWRMRA